MKPKYSILLCNQAYADYEVKIKKWIYQGIKVIWFGATEEVEQLKNEHPEFAKEFLLQAYSVNFSQKGIIIDGLDKDGFINILEKECSFYFEYIAKFGKL